MRHRIGLLSKYHLAHKFIGVVIVGAILFGPMILALAFVVAIFSALNRVQ